MKLQKYLRPDLSTEVTTWVNNNLSNYLSKKDENENLVNNENYTEIEHIVDYLNSDEAPKRLRSMSYDEAKASAKKWNDRLIKRSGNIVETEQDTETVITFEKGFKLVKILGENAFKREGNLMRHCVASYVDKDTNVYSIRDAQNKPHCTMEVTNSDYIQQIKGKGNGHIHPKYIDYVIQSLEYFGMKVNSNEMSNLGYDDISNFNGLWTLLESNFKNVPYVMFNNVKYLYRYAKFDK